LSQSNNSSPPGLASFGIVGGTFDPIHSGHLVTVHEAAEKLGIQQVYFVPAANPPHRSMPVADSHHRLAMLELALKGYPEFVADTRELHRPGYSYTVDTLSSFRQEFGDDVPIMMFIGADAFNEISSWHKWQSIPELAHVIVLNRPGFAFPDLSDLNHDYIDDTAPVKKPDWTMCLDARELHQKPNGLVYFQSVKPVDISATRIRQLLAKGRQYESDLSRVLPPAVYAYILENDLYTSTKMETECNLKN